MPAQTQILRMKDFSGGISDSLLPNAPNQYLKAENLLITDEKGLRTRPGSDLLDSTNYELPDSGSRINGLVDFQGELVGVTGQRAYLLGSTWSELTGPSSNHALSFGDEDGHISSALWKDHLYLVNDQGAKMVKIYRDEDDAIQLRTAGLPAMSQRNWVEAEILSKAIQKANDARGTFLLHLEDWWDGTGSPPADSPLHSQSLSNQDAVNLLSATTPATDEASLYTLCKDLADIYQVHIEDAQLRVEDRTIHMDVSDVDIVEYGVINADLNSTEKPTTLEEAVEFLDDFHQKYSWHDNARHTHGGRGLIYNRHPLSVSKIGPLLDTPEVTPNLDLFCAAANELKQKMSTHMTNEHVQPDRWNTLMVNDDFDISRLTNDVPDASDLDSLYNLIAHLRFSFHVHRLDSLPNISTKAPENLPGVATSSSGSSTLTGIVDAAGNDFPADAAEYAEILGMTVVHAGVPFDWATSDFTTVDGSFSSAGQITLSQNADATDTNTPLVLVNTTNVDRGEIFHTGYEQTDASLEGTLPVPTSGQGNFIEENAHVGILPGDLSLTSWLAALNDVREKFVIHANQRGSTTSSTQLTSTTLYSDELVTSSHSLGSSRSWALQRELYSDASIFKNLSVSSYLFAFHYSYSYSVGDAQFEDVGPVVTVGPIETSPIGVRAAEFVSGLDDTTVLGPDDVVSISISNIPSVSNGVSGNYDTGEIKKQLFRTEANGTIFFNVDEISNSTETYTDTRPDTLSSRSAPYGYLAQSDAAITARERIYTAGGQVDNDPPPPCKQIMLFEDVLYYGGITDGDDFLPKRIIQSIPADPDSAPRSFFVDLDEDFVAFGKTQNNRLAFSREAGYRLNGLFDSLGRGGLTAEKFDDTTGCLSRTGAVNAQGAVFYPGIDGFYQTNGFDNRKISTQFEDRYLAHTKTEAQKDAIVGRYDPHLNLIWWAMQSSETGGDYADSVFVLNLRYGTPFTYFTAGDNFRITSLVFWNDQMIRGDERGYIFRHNNTFRTDPKVDTDETPTDWGTSTIKWEWLSPATDFGNSQMRKWVNRWTGKFRDRGNLALDIESVNDGGRATHTLKPILFEDEFWWGDPSFEWGDSSFIWNPTKFIDQWRRFPSGSLRTNYKQLRLKNAFTEIAKSDVRGDANRAGTSGGEFTVTLNPTGDYKWPQEPHEYFIYFEDDSYVQGFEIVGRTSDTVITASDPDSLNPGASNNVKWLIRGYPKLDRMYLLEMGLHYYMMGRSQRDWAGAASEGVGTNE